MIEYKVSLIEDSLEKMDASTFQEMCDMILPEEILDFAYAARTGSQMGKRKTRKGIPDTGFLLRNGKYLLVEYTTTDAHKNKKGLIKKLEKDIQKGLEQFPPDKIERVILAFNSAEISLKEACTLHDLTNRHKIKLDILGLDYWTRHLSSRYCHLAQDYLGLSLSSRQVLSLKQFVTDYAKIGFQPGLQHKFFSREEDLVSLKDSFWTHHLTFIAGKAGIGKSRLCVEAIRQFLEEHLDWSCLCITKLATNRSIYEELQVLLSPEKNYLLFIDDANRQREHLAEVLEMLAYERSGQLRVVATVRDYALRQLQEMCSSFASNTLNIQPLSTEILTDILKGPDFKIRNEIYRRRILKIAQGNARIVVMLAELALAKQDIEALNDVSNVYDLHFDRIKGDCEELRHPTALKVLGLLAFFYSIDTADTDRFHYLLHCFSVEEKDFRQYAENLDALELLEISPDKQVYRIADQTLASYLFYKIFIKENLLSFEVLLREYLIAYNRKISEHIISANNDFGPEKIKNFIYPTLRVLWNEWQSDMELVFQLLDIFWFYLEDECLAFVAENIAKIPIENNPVFKTSYDRNEHTKGKEPLLDLLEPFLHYHFPNFQPAVELGFEYVTRRPEAMPIWMRQLTEKIVFSQEDERFGFHRQQVFLNCLLAGVQEGKSEYRTAWKTLAAHLLKASFQIHGSGIDKNSVSFYTYSLPDKEPIQVFRSQIWNFINDDFRENPATCFQILQGYPAYDTRTFKPIFYFDLPFFLKL